MENIYENENDKPVIGQDNLPQDTAENQLNEDANASKPGELATNGQIHESEGVVNEASEVSNAANPNVEVNELVAENNHSINVGSNEDLSTSGPVADQESNVAEAEGIMAETTSEDVDYEIDNSAPGHHSSLSEELVPVEKDITVAENSFSPKVETSHENTSEVKNAESNLGILAEEEDLHIVGMVQEDTLEAPLDEIPEELHHEEEEEELEGMSKQDLLKIVQEAYHYPESRKLNLKVQQARTEFFKVVEDEKREQKEKFLAEDEKEEKDFVPVPDPIVRDFNIAFKAFKAKRKEYIDDLNRQKEINLQLKRELLEKLKELTEGAETQSSFNDIKKIQEEWKKIGHVPISDADNLWNTYNYHVNKFYDQFSLYSEFKDLDRKRNMTIKEEIIKGIEKLAEVEDIGEVMKQLRQYQEEWRHIGPVPREFMEDMSNRYKASIALLYDRREKISAELQVKREQNYEAKIAILEKITEIGNFQGERVQDWIDNNKYLGEWIEKWRAIGSIPQNKRIELKQAFAMAIRSFNKNKNDFFRNRKREKVDNLKKKMDLCDRVDEIMKLEDPQNYKKEVIQLQDDWKKVGPVPPKYSDKVWKRFQAACDEYFSKLAQQYSSRDKEHIDNLNLKNELIDKAEAIAAQPDLENAEQVVKEFQDQWAAIGYVPFKEKDKVRKRFYKVLNLLASKIRGGGLPSRNAEMLSYKLMLEGWAHDNDGDRRIDQEERRLIRELRKLENEVATLENNMDFLSKSKNADSLRNNLEQQIHKLRSKMTELNDKIRIVKKIETSA